MSRPEDDFEAEFEAEKEFYEKSKETRRKEATDYLIENNIPFRTFNNGIHLQIDVLEGLLNFWPTTGRWAIQNRTNKYKWGTGGYTLSSMLRFLKNKTLIVYY